MMTSLDQEVLKWVYERITDNSTVLTFVGTHPNHSTLPNVYSNLAIEGASVPMIVFKIVSANPVLGAGSKAVLWKYLLFVELIVEGETSKFSFPVFAELESLFHQTQVDGLEAVIAGCHVQGKLPSIAEPISGGKVRLRHVLQVRINAYSNA